MAGRPLAQTPPTRDRSLSGTQRAPAMSGIATATPIAPRILASAANGVVDAIAALGADPDRVLGAAAIRAEDLQDPMQELTLARYCELFEAAARQTRDDN